MNIWDKLKKCLPICSFLPTTVLTVCIVASLSDYTAPVPTTPETIAWNDTTTAVAAATTQQKETTTTSKQTTTKSKAAITTESAPTVATVSETGGYQDGTYTGTGTGFRGEITVQVVISGGKIVDISILSASDDSPYLESASALLQTIIATQSTNVDTVSGATYSSVGLISAVRNALQKAGGSESGDSLSALTASVDAAGSQDEEAPSVQTVSEPDAYQDGVYTGTGEGYRGDITVQVVVSGGSITDISILSSSDDSAYLSSASALLNAIIATQSTNVDTVSGATFSSVGLIEAVRDALISAGIETAPVETTTVETTTTVQTTTQITDLLSPEETDSTTEEVPSLYLDGEFTATAICTPDDSEDFLPYTVSVTICIEHDKIVAIKDIVGYDDDYDAENDFYLDRAANGTKRLQGVIAQILEQQQTENIDVVSGATCSSHALIDAIAEAWQTALRQE